MHKKSVWMGPWLVVILFFFLTLLMVIRYVNLISQEASEESAETSYRYHIAMITNDQDAPYWNQVYESAQMEADHVDALIERMGTSLLESMSVADQLRMALYSHVDGVLVYPEDNEEVQQAIDQVVAAGIPVITMQRDSSGSDRQAFVGINDYFLGQAYGQQIQKQSGDEDHVITVLYPGNTFGAHDRRWFLQGLRSTLDTHQYTISGHVILEYEGLSNAESTIDRILEGADHEITPDLLICLNDTITEVAYRIVEDRGAQGMVKIAGGSISDTLIDGIERGDISFTITPNAADTGRKAFQELERYLNYGVANYASAIELQAITRENVAEYRKGQEAIEETSGERIPGLLKEDDTPEEHWPMERSAEGGTA